MSHTGGVINGTVSSPRPLGQRRQMASGDLQHPQGRRIPLSQLDMIQHRIYNQQSGIYDQQSGIYNQQSGIYGHHNGAYDNQAYSGDTPSPPQATLRHIPRHAPAGDHHDNTYVSMTDYQTTFHRTFPALCDSLDSHPQQTQQQQQLQQQQQQQHYLCDVSSSSSSSLDNSGDAGSSTRLPNRKRKRAYVPHVERKAEVVVKRNARERRRMGNLQGAFRTLQQHLPVVKHSCRRIPKEKLLRVATDYIRHLQVLLTHPHLLQGQGEQPIPQLSFLPQSPAAPASPDSMTAPTSPIRTEPTSPLMTTSSMPASMTEAMSTSMTYPMSMTSQPVPMTSSPGSSTSCLPPGTSPMLFPPSVTSPASSPEPMVASPAVSDVVRSDVKISHPYVMTPEGQDEAHLDLSPTVMEHLEEFGFLDKAEMQSLFSW